MDNPRLDVLQIAVVAMKLVATQSSDHNSKIKQQHMINLVFVESKWRLSGEDRDVIAIGLSQETGSARMETEIRATICFRVDTQAETCSLPCDESE